MNRLKELRKEKKLTQQELADELGIHFRTLQNWENEKADIKSDKAQQLADYFGVSVGYLLGYSEYKDKLDALYLKDIDNYLDFSEAEILSSVGKNNLVKLKNKFFSDAEGTPFGGLSYATFLEAISLLDAKNSELLIYFNLLDSKEQKTVLDLLLSLSISKDN